MRQTLDRIEQYALDVILERRWGKRATALRWLLRILSWIFTGIVRLRLYFYEHHLAQVQSLGCLVVSVGNLTAGGTGKTPIVEIFARALTERGRKVAILSRGYKSVPRSQMDRWRDRFASIEKKSAPRVVSDGKNLFLDSLYAGDEPYMLAKNLRDVVVLVDKDRVKAGHYAVRQFGVDTLILDDGFQYLPLKDRTDIVLIDREAPWGNGYLLPRGMLREPKAHLRRAATIFITKCDGSDLSALKAELRKWNRHAELIECRHEPLYLEEVFTGKREPLEFLQGLRVGVVSGIARPESFETGLQRLGAEVIYAKRCADHHRFENQEILNALTRSRARGARALVTTEKDAVRFPKLDRRDLPVYFLRVEIRLLDGHEAFHRCVERMCQTQRVTTPEEEAQLLGLVPRATGVND